MPHFRHTNALAGETSPYLLQHARNPVDWMPWGEAAFAKACAEKKPLFLSVGYATCYWCHVMEREVFENEALAQVVNQVCVCVKVDREERPDVDALYMAAVQLTGGRGGWPMSVFLTPPGAGGTNDPGLKPFWGGTYIPPSAAYGQPGFAQLVEAIGRAWRENPASVVKSAESLADGLRAEFTEAKAQVWTKAEAQACAAKTVAMLGRMYDPTHGGFGEAPKFPQPCWPHFLLNHAPQQLAQVRHTLDQMARGGIFDQIGGGFHRYSVDEKWLVPHFEKMLYDNGQLLALYADFLAANPSDELAPLCMRVLRQTGDYLLREMTDASGMFWTAQDAEVDGQEGLNYLWTPAQMREALGEADAKEAARLFGVDLGTNFQDPHHPHSAPSNVLFLPKLLSAQDEVLREKLALQLKAARDLRKQPTTDDKCLAAWNGLAIAGLARAGKVLGESRFIEAAARAAQGVLKELADNGGGLLRSYRQGKAGQTPGFLEDYACTICGLLALHETDGSDAWLAHAVRLAAQVEERFTAPEGGYFDSPSGDPHLLVRVRSLHDGAMPSASAVMAHNLRLLAKHTGDVFYTERLDRLLCASARVLAQANLHAVWLLDAAQ